MEQVLAFYADYSEDVRLLRHPVEFHTTTFIADRHIEFRTRVLDVASGTGPYAIHFAENGCDVVARDIVPKHIDILKNKIVADSAMSISCSVGNARDLAALRDCEFDAVLCMGPAYHVNQTDFEQCIKEARRVLRQDGVLLISYINKFAGYENDKYFEQLFFYSPDQIEDLMEKNCLRKIEHVPVDGEVFSKIKMSIENGSSREEIRSFLEMDSSPFLNPIWKETSLHAVFVGRKK